MTRPDYTHITAVLDRSGSMESLAQEATAAFHRFLDEQAAEPGRLTVTLVQFDDVVETVLKGGAPSALAGYAIKPRGMTALLDALGQAINATGQWLAAMPEHDRPGQVYVVVVTDGLENASKEWTHQRVFAAVKEQTDVYDWTFVFLAAGPDTIGQAAGAGITHAAAVASAPGGFSTAYDVTSQSVRRHRSARAAAAAAGAPPAAAPAFALAPDEPEK